MIVKKDEISKDITNSNDEIVIAFKNVHKSFGENAVLKGINLTVKKGENLVILGRSGSGKSVAIKCLVGLTKIDAGEINVLGTDVAKLKEQELNKIRMKIGFLFQNGALYDSMTVRENLAFTLEHNDKTLSDKQVEDAIVESLKNVGLEEAIDKMPSELSGGMKKRVGLARAIIIRPEIILYDEPTSGLDTITSKGINELIVEIQKKFKTSSIIITHDLACAETTGDRIMIIKDGVIYAEGSYNELKNSSDQWLHNYFN
ncbi:ABC transporter ATP-binding protein [Flavobacterium sp.]|uniref:ABC transporter ATP-binding protein n=1 Tax=Flavobacterium sp. TaxID=239 RepID=UPI003753DAF6